LVLGGEEPWEGAEKGRGQPMTPKRDDQKKTAGKKGKKPKPWTVRRLASGQNMGRWEETPRGKKKESPRKKKEPQQGGKKSRRG